MSDNDDNGRLTDPQRHLGRKISRGTKDPRKGTCMSRVFVVSGSVVLTLVLGGLLYQSTHSRIATKIYRDRLQALDQEYQQLRHTYNEAVAKTAVTELIVEEGQLNVAIRTTQGVLKWIPTPFDPSREIYVDYVILDGRLWIRRVFDADTPPGRGLVIDPLHEAVDWPVRGSAYGKAVYRALTDGRWQVTVTGDGSLGLAKVDDDTGVELISSPSVRDYDLIEKETSARVDKISPSQVIREWLMP